MIAKTIWKSKKIPWIWLQVRYGKRRSKVKQFFPVWNISNNNERALWFGFGYWGVSIVKSKKIPLYKRAFYALLPFKRNYFAWKLYNLIF